jgi:diadenosine tetraphosphate (Ap4A) HIT family hydrolase
LTCFSCEQSSRVGSLPPREEIYVDDVWRVAHAIGCALPGWLVVMPRRHITVLDELDGAELAPLGPLLGRLTTALRTLTGCAKTYVALFAEAEGFSHLHFHVVPRMPDFTAEQRGPRSLHAFLDAGERAVPEAEMDRIALSLQAELGGSGA